MKACSHNLFTLEACGGEHQADGWSGRRELPGGRLICGLAVIAKFRYKVKTAF